MSNLAQLSTISEVERLIRNIRANGVHLASLPQADDRDRLIQANRRALEVMETAKKNLMAALPSADKGNSADR